MTMGSWLLCAILLARGQTAPECAPGREPGPLPSPAAVLVPLQDAWRRLSESLPEASARTSSSGELRTVPPPASGETAERILNALRPQDRRILAATGYLDYVVRSTDRLTYHEAAAIRLDGGPELRGLSRTRGGYRTIDIAVAGIPDHFNASVLVHEAAHLEGFPERHRTNDERYARQVQQRFFDDYAKVYGGKPISVSETFPERRQP
jgi:hypothetical protein